MKTSEVLLRGVSAGDMLLSVLSDGTLRVRADGSQRFSMSNSRVYAVCVVVILLAACASRSSQVSPLIQTSPVMQVPPTSQRPLPTKVPTVDYELLKRQHPYDPEVYYTSGDQYFLAGDYEQAIADYGEVVRLRPNDRIAYLRRASAYTQLGKYDLAIADYNQAFVLTSEPDAGMYYQRGVAYAHKGDTDQAIADFTAAIQKGPEAPGAKVLMSPYETMGRAYCQRGLIYSGQDNVEKAETDLRRCLGLAGDAALRKQAEEQLRSLGQ